MTRKLVILPQKCHSEEKNCDFLKKNWFYHNSLKFQHCVFVKCSVGRAIFSFLLADFKFPAEVLKLICVP